MTGEGEGNEGQPFFCFRSNFRTITRLETLATQAIVKSVDEILWFDQLNETSPAILSHGTIYWWILLTLNSRMKSSCVILQTKPLQQYFPMELLIGLQF